MARKPTKKTPDKPARKRGPGKPKGTPTPAARKRGPEHPSGISQEVIDEAFRLHGLSWSQRQISAALGVSIASVGRFLREDPERRISVERDARVERAKYWHQLESGSLEQVLDWLKLLSSVPVTATGRPRTKFSDTHKFIAQAAPRVISSLAGLGDKATKQSQVLTGNPSDIFKHQVAVEGGDETWTPEEFIERARAVGMLDRLPAQLQELARKQSLGSESGDKNG